MTNDSFNNIGKRLPYRESEDYLDALIDKATQHAILQNKKVKQPAWRLKWITSAAAVVLILIAIGVAVMQHESRNTAATLQANGPLDEFLNTLSDEEAAQLQYYEIEEIPEY